MPVEFMDGKLTMRKTLSWVLMLGLVGCGNSEPAPQEAQTPTPAAASATPSVGNGPQTISPEQAVALATELIQKRNYNDASKLLNEAIQANPKLVEAYTTRASILSEAKLYTRAIRDMDVAIQLQPDNAKFLNTRGYFHLLLQNNGAAMEDFNQATRTTPNHSTTGDSSESP
jgi:Tfp pilus assembly protein PilF